MLCGPEDNASVEEQEIICTAAGYYLGRKSCLQKPALITYGAWVFWIHLRLRIKMQFPIGYYFFFIVSRKWWRLILTASPPVFSKEVVSDLQWVQPALSKSHSFP